MYIGLMFAFSSTMIVMKFLSDRKELSTLHGRIIVGILLMEDIFAIFALSILGSIQEFNIAVLGIAFLKFAALFIAAYLASKYLFPKVFEFAARRHELLLITSLAVCFLFSLAFQFLGFSIAIGAFVAGLALGNLRYQLEIIGKVKSLRDFFSLLFFVSLGMTLNLGVIKTHYLMIIIFTLFIVLFKPLLIVGIASLFRYTKKPSLYSGLYLTQVGEFALIIGALGLQFGHISTDTFSAVVMVSLISLIFTSYYIKYLQGIYTLLEKPLSFLDKFNTEGLEFVPKDVKPNVVLCGHNRIGYSVLRKLGRTKKSKEKILVVDYNPEIIKMTAASGFHCIYGEVDDEEIIEKMNLAHVKLLVSTVPGLKENLLLVRKTRKANKRARIIATAQSTNDALILYKAGADYVTLPHFLGGEHIANLVIGVRKKVINLNQHRDDHLKELKLRQKHGHDHPSYLY
jgi:Trk K+ transport system NAD-binding subunit